MARSGANDQTIAQQGCKQQLFRDGSVNPGGIASAMTLKEKLTNGVPAVKNTTTKRGR